MTLILHSDFLASTDPTHSHVNIWELCTRHMVFIVQRLQNHIIFLSQLNKSIIVGKILWFLLSGVLLLISKATSYGRITEANSSSIKRKKNAPCYHSDDPKWILFSPSILLPKRRWANLNLSSCPSTQFSVHMCSCREMLSALFGGWEVGSWEGESLHLQSDSCVVEIKQKSLV